MIGLRQAISRGHASCIPGTPLPAAGPRTCADAPPKGPVPHPEAPARAPRMRTQGTCSSRRHRRRPWCGWGHPGGLLPARRSPLAVPNASLSFPQLRVEPLISISRICSCIADGLKHRSALRNFIEGAHLFIESNPKQRHEISEMERTGLMCVEKSLSISTNTP